MTILSSGRPSALASHGSTSDCHWLPVWISNIPSFSKARAFTGSIWKCSAVDVVYVRWSVVLAPAKAASTPLSSTTSEPVLGSAISALARP